MKQKVCIILSALSLGLRALALIVVLLMTVLQEPVKLLYHTDPEVAAIHTVPWTAIVLALIWLILAGVILLVLMKRPGRGATIALTIVSALLYAFVGVVVSLVLNLFVTRGMAMKGTLELASSSVLSSAINAVMAFLSTPALILSLLALGGACGKSFRE